MAKLGSLTLRVPSKLTEYPESNTIAIAAAIDVIPLTHPRVTVTTGGADTLTLANGEPGQIINVYMTDQSSGTGTLTPATAVGFVGVTMADIGDQVTLVYLDDTLGWMILGATGVTAPPVITLS